MRTSNVAEFAIFKDQEPFPLRDGLQVLECLPSKIVDDVCMGLEQTDMVPHLFGNLQ